MKDSTQTAKLEALTEADQSQTRGRVASVTAGETATQTTAVRQKESESDTTTDELKKCFTFLDRLRESGRTNMWGAGGYLASEFSLGDGRASTITALWMETFDPDVSVEDRVTAARKEATQ
jgi:hypothetical protein